jgi:glucose dehydrogenase
MVKSLFGSWILPATAILCWTHAALAQSDAGWPNYGNDPGGSRYSAARQIDRTNVAQLQPVWTYRTGALQQQTHLISKPARSFGRISSPQEGRRYP